MNLSYKLRFKITKEKILYIVLILFPTILAFIYPKFYKEIFISFISGMILIMFLFTFGNIAYIFFKSLFYVSAEISLLIFIAQSYLASVGGTSDSYLIFFIIFGLVFIIIKLIKNISEPIKNYIKKMKSENKFDNFIFYILFILSIIISIHLFVKIFGSILRVFIN